MVLGIDQTFGRRKVLITVTVQRLLLFVPELSFCYDDLGRQGSSVEAKQQQWNLVGRRLSQWNGQFGTQTEGKPSLFGRRWPTCGVHLAFLVERTK